MKVLAVAECLPSRRDDDSVGDEPDQVALNLMMVIS